MITVISVITCVTEALAEAGGHDRSRRLALSGAREGVEHTGYLDPVGDKEELNVTRYTEYISVTRWQYLAAMRLSMSSDSFPVMADICTSIDPPAYA